MKPAVLIVVFAALLIGIVAGFTAEALALRIVPITTAIRNADASPIDITACTSGDSRILDATSREVRRITHSISFKNKTSEHISVVAVRFDEDDASGKQVAMLTYPYGGLESGASSDDNAAIWTAGSEVKSVSSVVCSIALVKFKDGTIWSPSASQH